MAFETIGQGFSAWNYLDGTDITKALAEVGQKLTESNGKDQATWDYQRDLLQKQFEMRVEAHNNGSDQNTLVESLKIELEAKLQAGAGMKNFDAYQAKLMDVYEHNVKKGLEFLASDDFYSKLKMQFIERLSAWEHQREDGLNGNGYHPPVSDPSRTVYAENNGDSYRGGHGITTIDFSNADSGLKIDMSKNYAGGFGDHKIHGFGTLVASNFDDYVKGTKRAEHIDGGNGNDILRGLGGSDTMTGGAGNDSFVIFKKDAVAQIKAGDVDVITDFGKGDQVNLSNMFKRWDHSNIDKMVAVKDDGEATHLYAKINGEFHEVAVLNHVTGMSAADMVQNGMILI